MWTSALALLGLSAPLSPAKQSLCELAPSLSSGLSSEGRLSSMSALNFGCTLGVYSAGAWTFGPRLDYADSSWSIFKSTDRNTKLFSYQARTLSFGLRSAYEFQPNWSLSYSLSLAQGRGSHNQSLSTDYSSQNIYMPDMKQKSSKHELTLLHRRTDSLTMLAGLQLDSSQQSWDFSKASLFEERVTSDNRLSLGSGSAQNLVGQESSSASYRALTLKLGLALQLGAK